MGKSIRCLRPSARIRVLKAISIMPTQPCGILQCCHCSDDLTFFTNELHLYVHTGREFHTVIR